VADELAVEMADAIALLIDLSDPRRHPTAAIRYGQHLGVPGLMRPSPHPRRHRE
jgi:hypothetical protein